MTIWIDPGHGGSDPGVVDGTRFEKDYNLDYALTLKYILAKSGYKVKMTRYDDSRPTYKNRTQYTKPEDIFLSIHFNSVGTYPLLYVKQDDGESSILAKYIENEVQYGRIWSTTRSRFGKLYIDDTKCPSVLIEVDTIDRAWNHKEARLDFAEEILSALEKYFNKE